MGEGRGTTLYSRICPRNSRPERLGRAVAHHFSATRPRFPTRREIAIFTPIRVISPRFQILSVFGDNSARDRGGKRYPATGASIAASNQISHLGLGGTPWRSPVFVVVCWGPYVLASDWPYTLQRVSQIFISGNLICAADHPTAQQVARCYSPDPVSK